MVATVGSISIDLSTNVAKFASGFRSAATTVDRESGRMARGFKSAENNLLAFARASVGAFAAGFGTREIGRYADAWTEAGNKVRAAGEIADRQGRSLSGLNDIATETRTGLTETVDLYAKLLRSTANVAKSEREVALATEIVNKAFKAGGAAASEQAAGILQLGQALGSGFLQGDELRSIRENAPLLAKAIADEFGVTIGGLKALGAQGAVTSERVFKAILAAQGNINKAFSETTATLGESITLLKNTLIETIGKLDQATGFTNQFTTEIGNLNSAIDGFVQNPNFATFLKLIGGDIREGSFVDNLLWYIDTFEKASTATATEAAAIRAEIQSIENQIHELILLGSEFDLLNAEKLAEDADFLKGKLKEIENAAMSAMASMHRAAEDASMAALAEYRKDSLPRSNTNNNRTVDPQTNIGIARFSSSDITDAVGEGTGVQRQSARTLTDIERDLGGYFSDLGSRMGGGFNQIDTTFANLGATLLALRAEGIMNPEIDAGTRMAGDNPLGSTLSVSRKKVVALGFGDRGTSPINDGLRRDSPRSVEMQGTFSGATINLTYQAAPGESESTSRQRSRDMFDELQREAARR